MLRWQVKSLCQWLGRGKGGSKAPENKENIDRFSWTTGESVYVFLGLGKFYLGRFTWEAFSLQESFSWHTSV